MSRENYTNSFTKSVSRAIYNVVFELSAFRPINQYNRFLTGRLRDIGKYM